MSACNLCPRKCGIDRATGEIGFCNSGAMPVVARAAAHFGEEPCISGSRGSGTVFFSGCNLHCVFCQNSEISRGHTGREVSIERLAEIFNELENLGVHNLNLVTATHFADSIVAALRLAKPKIPVVWNCSGYETIETLDMLAPFVQVFMPDLKYSLSKNAERFSAAPDYPEIAPAAIEHMFRLAGKCVFDSDGFLQKGVLIRHLILPNGLEDALDVIDFVSKFPKGEVFFSLMSQFTPLADKEKYPELSRKISLSEHERALRYMKKAGIESGYSQDLESATDEMIPSFDLTGI